MPKVLSIRTLNRNDDTNQSMVEVLCDGERRAYFKKVSKTQAELEGTTIRVTQADKHFEARILGLGWRTISEKRFNDLLGNINLERRERDWPPVVIPSPADDTSKGGDDVRTEGV